MDHTTVTILNTLRNGAKRTTEIAELTSFSRLQINTILRSNEQVECTDDTPPVWMLKNERNIADNLPKEYIKIILIDLGNIHHILPLFEPYANTGTVRVYAFADVAYNGYGVNPSPKNKAITVIRSKGTHRNEADLNLIWKIFTIVTENKTRMKVFIFTKDLGFQSLPSILYTYDHVLETKFVKEWGDVRDEIE